MNGRWSLIAGRLPGRTDNEIKNYWNTHIKRKLISRGIDPQTHRSLNGATSTAVTTTSTTVTAETTPTTKSQGVPSICLDFRNSTAAAISPAVIMEETNTKPTSSFKLITSDISSSSADQDSATKCCSSGTTTEEITQARPLPPPSSSSPSLPPSFQFRQVQNVVKQEEEEEEEGINLELSIGLPRASASVSVSASSNAASYSSSAESKISYGLFWSNGVLPAATATGGGIVGVCSCWQLGLQKGGQLCRNCQIRNGGFRYSSC